MKDQDDIESPFIDILLYGAKDCGRSSFYSRYKNSKFDNTIPTSDQYSFYIKNIVIDNLDYKIRLWDPCIKACYTMIPNEFYDLKNTGILILVDLTTYTIYEDTARLHQFLYLHEKGDHCLCFVGTKNDLVGLRKISSEDMLMIAERYGIGYMECSSLTGFGVDECIMFTARHIIDKYIHIRIL
ncbi:hypothetical protein SteCoe_25580 [Stentor coeruleus]|uniref:Uncharacterized protein n=1 Tax=Stentor coeruleus TaxID=5963 RepID=A0A1R2BF83_9CILI|nr:hypothetical protein SteCoe_25580 [Stentor coeruleus]